MSEGLGPYISSKLGYESDVNESGIAVASARLLEKTGVSVELFADDDTLNVINEEPALVIATHVGILNRQVFPVALTALFQGRSPSEVRFVSDELIGRAYPAVGNSESFLSLEHDIDNDRIHKFLYFLFNQEQKTISTRDRSIHNLKTLQLASDNVNNRGATLYFPDGMSRFRGNWSVGISRVINGIKNPDAQLIFAYVEGLKPNFINKRILRLHLSETKNIVEMFGDLEGKSNSRERHRLMISLKECYDEWSRQL